MGTKLVIVESPAKARKIGSFLGDEYVIEASVGNAKTDWLAQNNGQLGRAKNTFIAGDFSAKPGETFTDFSQRVVQSVSKNYGSKDQSISDSVARIPTKDNKPAPVNIRSQADAILSGGR